MGGGNAFLLNVLRPLLAALQTSDVFPGLSEFDSRVTCSLLSGAGPGWLRFPIVGLFMVSDSFSRETVVGCCLTAA